MDLLDRYEKTIETLERGHRFQQAIEPSLEPEILTQLSLEAPYLNQTLCVLQNTSSFLPSTENQLISILESCDDAEIIIHTLNAARKHIISARQRDGKRLDFGFLEVLKKLIEYPNWEVKEWVVRTVDECGSQVSYFADGLKKIYPSKLGMLTNQHKRHIRGIIDLMIVAKRIK